MQIKMDGQQYKFGDRTQVKFHHHAFPLRLDSALTAAYRIGYLLIQLTGDNLIEYIPLSLGQQRVSTMRVLLNFKRATLGNVLLKSACNCGDQILFGRRLRQEVHRTPLHCQNAHWDIPLSREEHNG
jgi:hypothetical protein